MQSFIGAGIVVGGVETVRQEIASYVHTYTQHKSEMQRNTHRTSVPQVHHSLH